MNLKRVMPVLFGFFVMGFCDVVGIATSYVKADFGLSETLAGFIPSAVFMWFLLLSVPIALLMNKIGRKMTVQLSNVVTFLGMMIPFFAYTFSSTMIAFALLGIGNTMLQVSLNPLLTNVVKGDSLTSSLTAGQVVKAISSFVGPFIAIFATAQLGNWQYLFPIFAAITLLSALWLMATPIEEEPSEGGSSIGSTFSLLSDKNILFCVLGIVAVVGLDVGMNTVTPKLLMESARGGLALEQASLGSSVYFLCRTAGAFVGAILLIKMGDKPYMRWNMLGAAIAMAVLFFAKGQVMNLVFVGAIGFLASSIFAVIFSLAMKARPDKANEISGLMITGVCGGAIIPPLMGFAADSVGSQVGSLIVLSLCVLYLLSCSFLVKTSEK
ncbi:MAG: MFS transporter [Rikenellaceae bacterium]